MQNVRFIINAVADESAITSMETIEEVFAFGLELENLTKLVASGRLVIEHITFEDLEN